MNMWKIEHIQPITKTKTCAVEAKIQHSAIHTEALARSKNAKKAFSFKMIFVGTESRKLVMHPYKERKNITMAS